MQVSQLQREHDPLQWSLERKTWLSAMIAGAWAANSGDGRSEEAKSNPASYQVDHIGAYMIHFRFSKIILASWL